MRLNVNEFPGVLNRAFLGFDDTLDKMRDFASQEITKYPPHNVIKSGEDKFIVELAVAGFAQEEIDVEIHDRTLRVKGIKKDTQLPNGAKYLHQGIAARNFQKEFTVADTVKPVGVEIVNGILRVYLTNQIPEEKKPQKVPFKTPEQKFLTE